MPKSQTLFLSSFHLYSMIHSGSAFRHHTGCCQLSLDNRTILTTEYQLKTHSRSTLSFLSNAHNIIRRSQSVTEICSLPDIQFLKLRRIWYHRILEILDSVQMSHCFRAHSTFQNWAHRDHFELWQSINQSSQEVSSCRTHYGTNDVKLHSTLLIIDCMSLCLGPHIGYHRDNLFEIRQLDSK